MKESRFHGAAEEWLSRDEEREAAAEAKDARTCGWWA